MDTSKTWIEVSKSALVNNIRFIKTLIHPHVKICAVVKANAYGHGLIQVATTIQNKIDYYAVDHIEEALEIRDAGITKPILVLGYLPLKALVLAINNDISFVMYNNKFIDEIVDLKLNKKAKIHLKIETGLNRQGIKDEELRTLLKKIMKFPSKIFIEGAYTHFANIEDTLDSSFALQQVKNFKKQLSIASKLGIKIPIVHCSASAGALIYPEFNFDMIRYGIGLYGLWPSRETAIALSMRKVKSSLIPVMKWRSLVAQIKTVETGESVSYGRTWFASRKSKIAIIPVGYSDGYDRGLSNVGRVHIEGLDCPVVGRVAMNMIMVDVTDNKKVTEGSVVELLGKNITADEIASRIGTINYEIISRVSPLIERKIVK